MLFTLIFLILLFLVARIPIFVALAFPPVIVLLLFTNIPILMLTQQLFAGMDKFSLMSMPFFIFAANVMTAGGLSRRIIKATLSLVGSMHGGLGITTQVATMFFGALSGSSPATVVAMGTLMYPAMIENKYPKPFSAGLISTSGAVAILIPPSITMVIYGAITGTSVGALFIAGIGAGILYGFATLAYCYYYAVKHKLPRGERQSKAQVAATLREASWALGVPLIILGGIYFGVFTPTESAGISVVYAIFVGFFIYKDLNWKKFYDVCLKSAVTSAEVMMLTAAAAVLGWVMTILQVPQLLTEGILSISSSPYNFLLMMNIFLLVLGCFVDGVPAVTLVAPLLYPITTSLGIDPVHLGIIITANMAIGMFTPPFGLNLIVASEITKQPLEKLVPGCIPFFVVSVIALLVLTYLPQISLWLPSLVY